MKREQFTFYRSFRNAAKLLPDEERLKFLDALCDYALDEAEPEMLGASGSAFCIIRPILDKARRKAESGRAGGSKSKTNTGGSKAKQAKACSPQRSKQVTDTDTETVTDTVTDTKTVTDTETAPVTDNKDDPPTPLAGGDGSKGGQSVVGVVVRAVGDLSEKSRAELEEYAREMGTECILRAVDTARDAGKSTWGYIRGILRRKREQGVASAADWDRQEAAHAQEAAYARETRVSRVPKDTIAGTPRDVQPSAERAQKSADWLENFLIHNSQCAMRAESHS